MNVNNKRTLGTVQKLQLVRLLSHPVSSDAQAKTVADIAAAYSKLLSRLKMYISLFTPTS